MPTTKLRTQCGECFNLFAASSLRRKPDTGKRVCRPCLGKLKAKGAVAQPAVAPQKLMWYVLYVEFDCDQRVGKDLRRRIAVESRETDIPNVIVPTHKVTTYKDGRAKVTNELSFPGYVIVECRWSEDVHHFITSTRGVWGVLPMKPQMFGAAYAPKQPPKLRKPRGWEIDKTVEWKPTALESEEAARLLISQAVNTKTEDAPLDFAVGDRVLVLDGTFKGMSGPVLKIHGTGKERKATVRVTMWGRDLEVEVLLWQAKKEAK